MKRLNFKKKHDATAKRINKDRKQTEISCSFLAADKKQKEHLPAWKTSR
jgi:hypothetical protein